MIRRWAWLSVSLLSCVLCFGSICLLIRSYTEPTEILRVNCSNYSNYLVVVNVYAVRGELGATWLTSPNPLNRPRLRGSGMRLISIWALIPIFTAISMGGYWL